MASSRSLSASLRNVASATSLRDRNKRMQDIGRIAPHAKNAKLHIASLVANKLENASLLYHPEKEADYVFYEYGKIKNFFRLI